MHFKVGGGAQHAVAQMGKQQFGNGSLLVFSSAAMSDWEVKEGGDELDPAQELQLVEKELRQASAAAAGAASKIRSAVSSLCRQGHLPCI